MIENIRRHGVHLTYVSDACECCARPDADSIWPDAPDDPVADRFEAMGGDPVVLPPRIAVPFCYTTGLFGVGHPELIVTGLPPQPAAALLNTLARRVIEDGRDLTPGEVLELDDLDGLRVLAETLPAPGMTLAETYFFYERDPVEDLPTLHLTWADQHGRFPWEEGYECGPWPQPRPREYRA